MRTLTVSIYSTWVTRSDLAGAAQIALAMLALVPGARAAGALGATAPALRQRRAASTADRSGPPVRDVRRRGDFPSHVGSGRHRFLIPFAYLFTRRSNGFSSAALPSSLFARIPVDGHLRSCRDADGVGDAGLAIAYSVRRIRDLGSHRRGDLRLDWICDAGHAGGDRDPAHHRRSSIA